MGKFGDKTREARLRWYGHLRRKDDGYIGRRMLRMELPGKRKRGRPESRFMDVVKEDMSEVEATEEDTVDRNNWRRKIRCVDPWWEKQKEEEEVPNTRDCSWKVAYQTLHRGRFLAYERCAVIARTQIHRQT